MLLQRSRKNIKFTSNTDNGRSARIALIASANGGRRRLPSEDTIRFYTPFDVRDRIWSLSETRRPFAGCAILKWLNGSALAIELQDQRHRDSQWQPTPRPYGR
jgi:hypothetical protein